MGIYDRREIERKRTHMMRRGIGRSENKQSNMVNVSFILERMKYNEIYKVHYIHHMLPVIPTGTGAVFKVMESSSISHNNLNSEDLRDQFGNFMTVIADTKVLEYTNGNTGF